MANRKAITNKKIKNNIILLLLVIKVAAIHELPAVGMEKASNVQENHHPRVMPRKERERGAHQREPKGRKQRKAPSEGKERLPEDKPEANQLKTEQEKEVKLKSTVVDIDSVREKEESLALLETAEQEDGEYKLFKEL